MNLENELLGIVPRSDLAAQHAASSRAASDDRQELLAQIRRLTQERDAWRERWKALWKAHND
ncbi:MAG: hypothetical protein KY445_07730 [Armatimonadetes bacterium]|nr:hypothetical protein [Armatimonadota bacterium]